MQKQKMWLFFSVFILLSIGIYLGWLDNGPRSTSTQKEAGQVVQ